MSINRVHNIEEDPLWTTTKIVDSTGSEWKVEANGGMPINIQDQTSKPIDAYFARSLSNFTLSADTGVSGIAVGTFVYTFTATAGHGISATDEILLLDVALDRSFFAVVTNVATNVITVDRPIDHDFTVAVTTLGRVVSTQMNVNGSVTPIVFSARAGVNEIDFTRFIIRMLDSTSMDDGKFGGITALTNGLVFRIVNSFQKTIFNFRTNGEIANFCFDTKYADRAPGGQYGFSGRITFAGPSKHGVTLRIGTDDVLQWVVQDDLTGLDVLQVVGQGHEVTD